VISVGGRGKGTCRQMRTHFGGKDKNMRAKERKDGKDSN
jgi:hypothetical protein